MADIIPRRNSWLTWLACLIIIVGGFLLFLPESKELLSIRLLYTIPLIALALGWILASGYWLKTLNDKKLDAPYEFFSGRFWFTIIFTAAIAIWIWSWSSQRRTDKQDKIEYNGKPQVNDFKER